MADATAAYLLEAENFFQCVDLTLCMRVDLSSKLLQRPFVVTDVPAHVIILSEMEHRRLRLQKHERKKKPVGV